MYSGVWACNSRSGGRARLVVAAVDPSRIPPSARRGTGMAEPVLPKLAKTDVVEQLPSDPTELLSEDEQRQLSSDLAKLAGTRRDAETDSGSLRLA
jgi:hypothetical protein